MRKGDAYLKKKVSGWLYEQLGNIRDSDAYKSGYEDGVRAFMDWWFEVDICSPEEDK